LRGRRLLAKKFAVFPAVTNFFFQCFGVGTFSSQDRIRTCMKSMCVSSPMGLPQGFPPAIARCSIYQFRHLT